MTPVIFRRYKDGDIVALFPAEPADYQGRYVSCYAHLGQHGSADYLGAIAETRPATPEEYADLLAELKDYGSGEDKPYADLEVFQRRNDAMRRAFNAELQRIRNTQR